MDQHTHRNSVPDNVQKYAQEDQARQLREEQKTFREIGALLGIWPSKARYLFLSATRRNTKRSTWTEGLNKRLANSLHWLGFQGKTDVTAALKSGHLQTLACLERGLRAPAIAELTLWLDVDDVRAVHRASHVIDTAPDMKVTEVRHVRPQLSLLFSYERIRRCPMARS